MSIFCFKKDEKIILNKEKKVKEKILEYNKKYNAPYGKKTNDDDSNLILSKNYLLGTNNKKTLINGNTFVIGCPGCGKTMSYIIPNLMQLNGNYIVIDLNNSIYDATKKMYMNKDYIIKRYGANGMYLHYNPFTYLKTEIDILRMVDILFETEKEISQDPFFIPVEKTFLVSLIGYMHEELPKSEQNFNTLYMLINKSISELDALFGISNELFYKKAYETFKMGTSRIQESIKVTCSTMVDRIIRSSAKFKDDEINFQDFRDKKTILYINLDIYENEYSLIVLLISQLYNYLISDYVIGNEEDEIFNTMHKHSQPQSEMKYPVNFFIDEADNIGRIPDLNQIINTSSSYNIQFSIIAQSISDLEKCYNEKYENIINSFGSVLYFGGIIIERETLEYLNKYCETRLYTDMLPEEQCILFIRGLKPIIDLKYNIIEHKRIKEIDL